MKPQPRYHRGDRIANRYLVHQALMGGMGEVYLCLDLEENYPYALKTFQQRYLTDTQRLRRAFEQEVATWVALEKHPNIVRCHWMQMLNNQPFMGLEWIAGKEGQSADLRGWLRRGPLDLKLTLEIAIDICNGLIHVQAKRRGLVHRDLKPENILMAQGGLAKITDFGLAGVVQVAGLEIGVADAANDGQQSFVGDMGIVGTPAYMAPEQWRGETLDERTDIYALGCVLYEMLTGVCPFNVNLSSFPMTSMYAWLRAMQAAHEHAPIPILPATVPDALNYLLQGCLAKKQTDRQSDLRHLLTLLTDVYLAQIGQRPPTRPDAGDFTLIDYNNRGITFHDLGLYEQALMDYDQAIKLDANDAMVYSNRGNALHSLGRYEQALAHHNRAVELDPTLAEAYSNRGGTYGALGLYGEALADFERALDLDSNYATAYFNRGTTYQFVGDHEQAAADYDHALALNPTLTNAYVNRGIAYYALERYQQALDDFEQAIKLNPNDAQTYTYRGNTYNAMEQYAKALNDYNYAIELDSTYQAAYFNRGKTFHALGQYGQALADYGTAIQRHPTDALAYYNRAITYHALSQNEQALADYGRAIEFDPNLTQAYLNRGIIYRSLRQYEQALADYSQAIELDANFAIAYSNRGLTYANLGQDEQALADYSRAIELDPYYSQAYFNRGVTYHGLGQYKQALTDYKHAIEFDPSYAKAYHNLGVLLDSLDRSNEALAYLEKAAQLGLPHSAQSAAQVRQALGLRPALPMDFAEQAFVAFQQADSAEKMWKAVERFPILGQFDFIAAIEKAIAEHIPPEHLSDFTQRFAWLRQIAKEQSQ